MAVSIGIMGEHKAGEHRIPLTPSQLKEIQDEKPSIQFVIQPSAQRIFKEEEFTSLGLRINMDLSDCPLVLAVKEIDVADIHPGKAYLYFSHTIKAQPYNMAMLKHILDVGATLLDYELIKDDSSRRLVFFGRHAGLAGMINSLWSYGQRLAAEGVDSPFGNVKQANGYADLAAAKAEIREALSNVNDWLGDGGPLVVGITGYGNVSKGAQEILDLVPHTEISPRELLSIDAKRYRGQVLKVVFKESDLVRPTDSGAAFDLQEYYDHPERYESSFDAVLPHLDILVNCIYWEERYPRLVTKARLRELFKRDARLKVIGDITCDIEGSVECNLKATHSDDPVYVYLPEEDRIEMGFTGKGPVVMAVDNLPTELPREASHDFGEALRPFVAPMGTADFSKPLAELELPSEIKRAIIAHQGELVPEFEYLAEEVQQEAK